MPKFLLVRTAVIAAVFLIASGCRQDTRKPAGPQKASDWPGFASAPGPILVGHPMKPSDLTESERNFGIAPKRGPGIEYQPDIVLMEHGDQAIRSFASNGLSWSFDANAPQVSDIQPGKIVFATGRAVGRVLATQRNGDQISAVLGPVQITDLVKQGNFAYSAPLDMNSLIAVVAPDYPGAVNSTAFQTQTPGAQSSLRGDPSFHQTVKYFVVSDSGKWTPMRTITRAPQPTLLRTNFHPSRHFRGMQVGGVNIPPGLTPPGLKLPPGLTPPPGILPPGTFNPGPLPTPNIPMIPLNGLQASPCITCGGLGLEIYQEKDGVKLKISIVFHLDHPHINFWAAVRNGGIAAHLELSGGAGITVKIQGGSDKAFRANIAETGLIPAEITLPIGGAFLPLEIKLSQSIDIHSGFSAKTSYLKGEGGVDLSGSIVADYNGGWEISPPEGKLSGNLAGLVTGVSVGINSMEFAVNQRLLVGLGALGFATGPYVDLITSITALKQSSIATPLISGLPVCGQGTLNLSLGAGVGYSMPRVVAKILNTFLSIFGAKPIPATGSIIALPKRKTLIDERDELPPGCSGK